MDKARQIEEIENRGNPEACYAVEHLFSMIALEMEKIEAELENATKKLEEAKRQLLLVGM